MARASGELNWVLGSDFNNVESAVLDVEGLAREHRISLRPVRRFLGNGNKRRKGKQCCNSNFHAEQYTERGIMAASDEIVDGALLVGVALVIFLVWRRISQPKQGLLDSMGIDFSGLGAFSGLSADEAGQKAADAVAPFAAAAGGAAGSAVGTSVSQAVTNASDKAGKTFGDWFWGNLQPFLPESWQAPSLSGPDNSELNWQNYHPFAGVTTDAETTSLPDYSSVPYIADEPVDLLAIQGQPLGV